MVFPVKFLSLLFCFLLLLTDLFVHRQPILLWIDLMKLPYVAVGHYGFIYRMRYIYICLSSQTLYVRASSVCATTSLCRQFHMHNLSECLGFILVCEATS